MSKKTIEKLLDAAFQRLQYEARCVFSQEASGQPAYDSMRRDLAKAFVRVLHEANVVSAESSPEETPVESAPPESWRCFHCDAHFTDKEEARLHFGKSERQDPACTIDVSRVREMEAELARYREEDTDLHREIHRAHSSEQLKVRRAEEVGYARGLRDASTFLIDSTGLPRYTPHQNPNAAVGMLEFVKGGYLKVADVEALNAERSSLSAAGHRDNAAIDRFAVAMKVKMDRSRAKGRTGWEDSTAISVDVLAKLLVEHVAKGDAVGVANFAMMLHQREAAAVASNAVHVGLSVNALKRAATIPSMFGPAVNEADDIDAAYASIYTGRGAGYPMFAQGWRARGRFRRPVPVKLSDLQIRAIAAANGISFHRPMVNDAPAWFEETQTDPDTLISFARDLLSEHTVGEALRFVDAVFETWWEEHGQFCRAGGGQYEKTFAYRAWEAALAQAAAYLAIPKEELNG